MFMMTIFRSSNLIRDVFDGMNFCFRGCMIMINLLCKCARRISIHSLCFNTSKCAPYALCHDMI